MGCLFQAKVITTEVERDDVNVRGRVRRVHNARNTCTMGMIFSPQLGCLRGYILFKKCTKAKMEQIRKRLGGMISVAANGTGCMRCETHVRFLVGEVLAKATERARRLLKLPTATALMVEDEAPGHIGDGDEYLKKCGSDDAEGWREKRIAELKKCKTFRAIVPRHGTPFLMPSDQVHQIIHKKIHDDIREQVGLSRDLTKRPKKDENTKRCTTASGYRRGPDEIIVARAFFRLYSPI